MSVQVIRIEDSIILSTENGNYQECYSSNFHLSTTNLCHRFKVTEEPFLFQNKTIVQWGIFTEARHPIFLKVLTNLVELIKYEYFNRPVVFEALRESRSHNVECVTGPRMMTATFREMMIENLYSQGNYSIRVIGTDFEPVGGTYKIQGFSPYSKSGQEYKHYSTYLKRHKINLLREYNHHE